LEPEVSNSVVTGCAVPDVDELSISTNRALEPTGQIVKMTSSELEESVLDDLALHLDELDREAEAGLRAQWRQSRRVQGQLLKAYRELYRPHGLFGKFLETIGLPSKTAYRLMEDADAVAMIPQQVLAAAEARGIDLAARKNRAAVNDMMSQSLEQDLHQFQEHVTEILSNLVEMPRRSKIAGENDLTPEESKHWRRRIKIRTAVNDIADDKKLEVLLQALEEEMADVWGLRDPIEITLTPRESTFTLDGKRRVA